MNLSDTLQADGNSPEEDLLRQEERAYIEKLLLKLPVQQRIAVIMRDVEGLPYEDIAESMQVSLGTVKSRILRGREALRDQLASSLKSRPAMRLVPKTAE